VAANNRIVSVRLRWLVALVAVVALAVQVAVAAVVWGRTRPRLAGVAAVAPLLDQAVGDVVSAVGDRAAVAVAGVVAYTACQNTFLARGYRFNRAADLYTDPGTEDTLIGTVTQRLPASDRPRRTAPVGGGAAPLTGDLGSGVTVRLSQLGEGWLEAVAETDCRTGHPNPDDAKAAPADRDAVVGLLAGLGTAIDAVHTNTLTCTGHRMTTLSAISRTADTANLPARLVPLVPHDAHRFGSSANRCAWRDPTGSTVVAASDDGTHITVQHTTPC